MWTWRNPVQVTFGTGTLGELGRLLGGRAWCLVTYGEPHFDALAERVRAAAGSEPAVVIRDVQANPAFTG